MPVDDPAGIADGMAEAALILMLRAGTVTEEAVTGLADEYDRRASWASGAEAERLAQVAHRLRVAIVSINPAPVVDPATEFRAQFLRKQMAERTARLTAVNRDTPS